MSRFSFEPVGNSERVVSEDFALVPWVYLHGTLESECKTDLLCADFDVSTLLGGSSRCIALVPFAKPDRKEAGVVAYLWREEEVSLVTHFHGSVVEERLERRISGLICNKHDIAARHFAAQAYFERRKFL